MTYYATTSKKRQAENALLRAKLGSPEGACFLPGLPVSYCVMLPPEALPVVHLRSWKSSGRCVREFRQPFPMTDGTMQFYAHEVRFLLRVKDCMIWRFGEAEPPLSDAHRARALAFFTGEDVTLDREAIKGDNAATSARRYYRRKEQALARLMPEGYYPLPGGFAGEPAAYCVHATRSVTVVRPTTASLSPTAGPDTLKPTVHPIHGDVVIAGEVYDIAGTHLVPRSKPLSKPLSLPDQVGWAQRNGNLVEVITPGGDEVKRETCRLQVLTFEFRDRSYKILHDKIVIA